MIDEYAFDSKTDLSALYDVELITRLLRKAACEQRSVSYSEFLMELGFRFTRPKMRELCKTLDEVDRQNIARGEPPLACLVVRESDRLPGQGWWVGRTNYHGQWIGEDARLYLAKFQSKAFRYWKSRAPV